MKLVCISDTHGYTPELPEGDVLIHCGDFNHNGNWDYNLAMFVHWFANQPHKHKILVPGNHDWVFDKYYIESMELVDNKFEVLIDRGIEIDGVKFYGTPSQPVFYDWAFNHRAEVREQKYAAIPEGTDVVITHTPPAWKLDKVPRGHVGCNLLAKHIERVKPKYHIFGHIHESYGRIVEDGIEYVNCAYCDDNYSPANKPVVVEIN